MIPEYKDLLLRDLCGRLPYEVILVAPNGKTTYQTDGNTGAEILVEEGFKPYLRPLSSMTKEEKEELKKLSDEYLEDWFNAQTPINKWKLDAKINYNTSVFYNSHHLDWNGLIELGLALEAQEGMYK